MTKEVHKLDTGKRIVEVEIEVLPDRVVVRPRFTRVGDLGDDDQLDPWIRSLLNPYADDLRPIIFETTAGLRIKIGDYLQ